MLQIEIMTRLFGHNQKYGARAFNPGDIKAENIKILVHKIVRSQVKRTPGESDASYVIVLMR